jgi:hypothetical protein
MPATALAPPGRAAAGTALVALAAHGFAFMPVLGALVVAAGVDTAWMMAARFVPAASWPSACRPSSGGWRRCRSPTPR